MTMTSEPAVELRGVQKRYGSVAAVAGVDLTIGRGEIVALLGPNGAGKTTTFELLLGLLHPSEGKVRVLGEVPSAHVRLRLGTMMQSVGLPEQVTVTELLRLVGQAHERSLPVDEVLQRVALAGKERRRVTDLSGGERQRLQLGMAIIGAPEMLLLDEPTAAMDVASRRSFWKQTRAAADQGITVLFATHDLTEAQAVAGRIVVMAGGRVLADASPADLTHSGADDLEDVFITLTEEISVAHSEGAFR
jgi:ABC-2 type transport system ATP-binding protein